ncbi:hypothetical protein [Halosimplex amylolyticum]|uniref:hypothetical protein n=1 Tax=Halosimplex amylolyticum TaxID=3396616 RepID=UPI003F5484E8
MGEFFDTVDGDFYVVLGAVFDKPVVFEPVNVVSEFISVYVDEVFDQRWDVDHGSAEAFSLSLVYPDEDLAVEFLVCCAHVAPPIFSRRVIVFALVLKEGGRWVVGIMSGFETAFGNRINE